jgi:shikimate kinase
MVNRTQKRAQEVSRRLGCDWAPAVCLPEVLTQSEALISCIPSGLSMVDPAWLHPGLVVLDADYKDLRLSQAAKKKECRVVSGLAWLMGQAVSGFRYFTGQDVPLHLGPTLLESLNRIPFSSPKSLVLIGFMGSGKTTVGKLLAAKLGYAFQDTDEMVKDRAGMDIPQIFKNLGEDSFRRFERSVIKSLSEDPAPKVIALGGGAVRDTGNRDVLSRKYLTIWLWVSPRNALKRINSVTRPLLKDTDGEDLAATLLKERMPRYAESSDLVLSTDDHSAADITQRIFHEMDQTL